MGLIVVGACYLDTILTVPHFPGEDDKLRASSVVRRRGGNGPNTLEVLAQLLHHPSTSTESSTPPQLHLISTLPAKNSPSISTIASSLGPHVDISNSIYRENETEPASSYIIRSQATGSRTIVNYNGLKELTLEEFKASIGALIVDDSFWHVHFEGRIPPTTKSCIEHLRSLSLNIYISVEVEKPDRPGLFDLAYIVDMVFYSRTWAMAEGYTSAGECVQDQATKMRQGDPKLLVCTWGGGPSAVYHSDRGYFGSTVEAIADEKVVDAVGAGDTFIAGMLYKSIAGSRINSTHYQLASKEPSQRMEGSTEKSNQNIWEDVWQDALSFANRLAGLKIQREGFDRLADDIFG